MTRLSTGRHVAVVAAAIAAAGYFVGRLLRASDLTGEQEWTYVSVRRFLLFLERSLDCAIRWAGFEPNDDDS